MIKVLKRVFGVLDLPLLLGLLLLTLVGLLTMYSAVGSTEWRFAGQVRNFILAFGIMWGMALIPPDWLKKVSVLFYLLGLLLLLAVLFVGITSKGATRWLNMGVVVIQPSEMLKLAVPMMLAWYFDTFAKKNLIRYHLVGLVLLLIPFFLILKQPDLGTSILVFASGFFVMYFAGFSFKVLVPIFMIGVVAIASILYFESTLCAEDFDWVILHEYQKHRVCTLLNPASDPLGKGFHTLQGMIAIGSGGVYGKGYLNGTQSHLDFVPESTTDFIFSVFAEEFGLYGCVLLLLLYALVIFRGLLIANKAATPFGRYLAGALSLMIFVYVFVNIGMVSGILPIVGVPLPFMSYGGTALVTLGCACGMLMSISYHVPEKSTRKDV